MKVVVHVLLDDDQRRLIAESGWVDEHQITKRGLATSYGCRRFILGAVNYLLDEEAALQGDDSDLAPPLGTEQMP